MKIFISLLVLFSIGFCSVASAQTYEFPLFMEPVQDQTGFYTLSTFADNTGSHLNASTLGEEIFIPNSGAVIEIVPPGGIIGGRPVGSNETFIWGQMTFIDKSVYVQSVDFTPIVPYSHNYAVVVFSVTYPNSTGAPVFSVIGNGTMIFDPLYEGNGTTLDLVFLADVPFVGNRTNYPVGWHAFRLHRQVANAVTNACDRSTVVDFSPRPPATQCN